MRRLLLTLILVAVCSIGFIYAYSQNFFMEEKVEPQPLVAVNSDDVVSFSVKNNKHVSEYDEVPHMELARTDDGKWQMTIPESYPLNSYSSDSWVKAFSAVLGLEKIEGEDHSLSEFGLETPRYEMEVRLNDGTSKTLLVGDQTPVYGFSYVKTGDSDDIYKADDEELKSLQKKPFDFLDKSPFQFEYNKLNSMYVEWEEEAWQITKDDPTLMGYQSTWKLGTLELSADDGSSFIDRMINISTNKMIKHYDEIDFNDPELRIMLEEDRGDADPETSIYFGKINKDNEDEVWVAKLGGKYAYAISLSQAENMYNKAYEIVEKIVTAEYEKEQAAKEQQGEEAEGGSESETSPNSGP